MASNIQPITMAYRIGGWGDQGTQWFPEGGSQSYPIGAPLKFSSGTVVVISSVTTPVIAGIALVKATGTTGSYSNLNAPVILPLDDVIFNVSVDTTTSSGPALGTGSPSNFNIGGTYQLLLDSTSGNYYMGTGASNAVFTLIGYDPLNYSVINGRVWVRILKSQTAWT
jgi:hypothetical protein